MFMNKPDKFRSITLILPCFHNVNCMQIVYFLPVWLMQNIAVSKSDCFSVVCGNITVCVLFVQKRLQHGRIIVRIFIINKVKYQRKILFC